MPRKITDPRAIREMLDAIMLQRTTVLLLATKHHIPARKAGEVLEGYAPFACCTNAEGVRKYDFGFKGEPSKTIALPDIEYLLIS